MNRNVVRDRRKSHIVSRVDIVIVRIDYVKFVSVRVIPLVAVALMSVQIDDQEPTISIPLLHVCGHKGDIWVDTKATSCVTSSVMVPA